jgi:hypothetical protein
VVFRCRATLPRLRSGRGHPALRKRSDEIVTLLQTFAASTYGLMLAVAGACAGAYLFSRGFRSLRRTRLILAAPASKVRNATLGLVEMSGLAVGPHTVNAPVTGVPCFCYRTLAWQLKQREKNKIWEKVADEGQHVPFYLDDNTGRALVDPQGANLDLNREFQDEFSTLKFSNSLRLPENVASFLGRHGVATDKSVKIEEYCIKPKSLLFVLGTLEANPGLTVKANPVRTIGGEARLGAFASSSNERGAATTAGVRFGQKFTDALRATASATSAVSMTSVSNPGGDGPEVIRLQGGEKPPGASAMTQQEQIAAALAKAGMADPAGWTSAQHSPVVTAASGGAAAAAPALAFDLKPKTVLMKGANEPGFYISWRSQRDVVQALNWKPTLMIWAGPALALVSVCVLVAHFAWK